MKNIKTTPLYMMFSIVFVACLLISNITAVKLITFGPLTLTAAVMVFPVTYIINDLLSEVYGYARAKFTIYMGFVMNAFMVLFFALTMIVPHPEYWTLQDAYVSVLGNTPRMLVASLCAYLVGTTLNSHIMVDMHKRAGGDRGLFWRCILSTLVGESCDSVIFVTIGFFGSMPLNAMIAMIFTQALFKTCYEIIVFPVTNVVIQKVKKAED